MLTCLSEPATNRQFWDNMGGFIRATKENMQPLLRNWLLADIQGMSRILIRAADQVAELLTS